MPKIRSNASSAYSAKRKYASERKRDDNLFPDDEDRSSKRRGGYGSRTREAEEREREGRDSRDSRDSRDGRRSERERDVDERESTRRGREESSRDDRRLQKEGRGRDRDNSSRDSQSLAEIRYQLNKMYNFMKDFKDDLTDKEMDAWDAICREADAEEFSLNKKGRSSRKGRDRDDDDDRDGRGRRSSSRRGDGDMRRHKGQDRYESNGLVKGDVKILLNVVDDERLDFRGSLGNDLFYVTDELHMGNYSRDYERAFLNLLRELDAIRLDNDSSRDDIDYLMDIYLPKDRRNSRGGRYDDDEDDRESRSRRSSKSRRKSSRRDDDDDDYDRRGRSSSRRSGRVGRDRDDDDDYDRRDSRRGGSSSSRSLRRGRSDRYDDDDRDYDRRDSRRSSRRNGRYSGGGRSDDRYSGRNGGTQRRGKSGFDFKYLDEVLYDLEQLPGFIDDLSDFGYEAYSYLVSAIRTEDDSSIAEDATVFMEELFAYGMDYALTDDEYDFLVNEASRYQSVANRYMGRQAYDNMNYRQAPVRRAAVNVQPTRVKRAPISRNADMNIVREDRTVPSSRKLPNENDAQVRPSRSYGKYAGRQPIETGNDYAFEPKRQNQKYVGRNQASRNAVRR